VKRTSQRLTRTRAVGVVVPVHNEEELLGLALSSLEEALLALRRWKLEIGVAVVLDSCSDASGQVVEDWMEQIHRRRRSPMVLVLKCEARNVGVARGLGCAALLDRWSHLDVRDIWLATTDGDSRVPKEWLTTQVIEHETGADLWTGRVAVSDWSSYRRETGEKWQALYDAEENPIHGTSLGFNASIYLDVGGFPSLETSEDRELHRLLIASGAQSRHDSSLHVLTSARRNARAPRGFAHSLELVDTSRHSSDGRF